MKTEFSVEIYDNTQEPKEERKPPLLSYQQDAPQAVEVLCQCRLFYTHVNDLRQRALVISCIVEKEFSTNNIFRPLKIISGQRIKNKLFD